MDASQATIGVTDDGLLRGDGVFEMIRLYDGRPFALAEHLSRLELSARNLRLPLDAVAVAADVATLLAAAPPADGALRLVMTRGGRRIGLIEPLPDSPPTVALGTVAYAPTRVLDGVKSLSYAANLLATRIAREGGADEALLVTPHGRVLESSTSSFFYVVAGRLHTPPLDDHVLDSITRRALLLETSATERVTSRDDLAAIDEAFLASTLREVHPVREIDGTQPRVVDGPVTRDAAQRLRAHIAAALDA